jgi:hypothetical protein
VSPVRYELGLYIPEDGILHSHRHENLKSFFVVSVSYILWKRSYATFALNESTVGTDRGLP